MSGPAAHPDDVDLFLAEDPDVLAHLRVCPTCPARRQRLQAEQDAVRAALVPLAGPVPVPPAVQRGVEQALAREARDSLTAAPDEPAPVDLGERRASRAALRARQWVAVAAAAAVVVVGAGVVLPRLGGADGARSASELQATGPAPEAGAEAGAGTTAGAAGSAAGDEAGGAAAPAVPALPSDVLAVATSLQPSLGLVESCGTTLASQLGAAVDAVADPAAPGRQGVLVVVDVPGARQAWWLPACDATRDQALGTSPVP